VNELWTITRGGLRPVRGVVTGSFAEIETLRQA
jgi:hypothetical protein